MNQPPEALFKEIEDFINDSRMLLYSGAVVELEGLDDRVQHMCETVLKLSQAERLAHADRLQQLLWSLTDLGEAMGHYRDAMAEEIRHLSSHKKANVAYRTSESLDKNKKGDA